MIELIKLWVNEFKEWLKGNRRAGFHHEDWHNGP